MHQLLLMFALLGVACNSVDPIAGLDCRAQRSAGTGELGVATRGCAASVDRRCARRRLCACQRKQPGAGPAPRRRMHVGAWGAPGPGW